MCHNAEPRDFMYNHRRTENQFERPVCINEQQNQHDKEFTAILGCVIPASHLQQKG